MAVLINEGWLVLYDASNSMLVYFESCKVDHKTNPKTSHFVGESGLRYNTKKQWYEFKVKNIWMTSHTNYSNFMEYLKSWNDTSPYTFTLKVIRNTSTDYIEWDGTNTEFTVAVKKDGQRGMQKVSPHDGDVYKIEMIIFEEV